MLSEWDRWYPNCEPIGHHLRWAFPDRWVRFHSLPGLKRYATDKAEYAEVLTRHNRILGELTQGNAQIVLLTTGYAESPEPIRSYLELQEIAPGAVVWRTIAMHQTDEAFNHPTYWHVFGSMWEWRPGLFNRVVELVSEEIIANVLIVARDCRWVLHPYDGGMDVIVESSTARDRLRAGYSKWLSPRADGL